MDLDYSVLIVFGFISVLPEYDLTVEIDNIEISTPLVHTIS